MPAPLDHAQRWTRAGAGGAPDCGMGARPATVIGHHKFQPLALPSLTAGGRSRRVGCAQRRRQLEAGAGAVTASGNCSGIRNTRHLFTPRVHTLDEIHELRICELTGRQAVITRTLLDIGHHVIHDSFDGPKCQSNRLSFAASDVEQHETKGVGSAQDSVGVFQYVGC